MLLYETSASENTGCTTKASRSNRTTILSVSFNFPIVRWDIFIPKLDDTSPLSCVQHFGTGVRRNHLRLGVQARSGEKCWRRGRIDQGRGPVVAIVPFSRGNFRSCGQNSGIVRRLEFTVGGSDA